MHDSFGCLWNMTSRNVYFMNMRSATDRFSVYVNKNEDT